MDMHFPQYEIVHQVAERKVYRNNLKNRFLAASAEAEILGLRSRLVRKQRRSLQTPTFQPPPCQIPDSSSCFGINGMGKVISADLVECHSSSQVEIDGKLFVAFKGRSPQSARKSIWLIYLDENGWSQPKEIYAAPDKNNNGYSPVFCKRPDGSVLLFYRVGPAPDQLETHVKMTRDGMEFEDQDELVKGQKIVGPTKTTPLQLDRKMIVGSSTVKGEWKFDQSNEGVTGCHIEIMDENGQWSRTELQMPEGYPQNGGAIEPTLFFYGDKTDGEIALLCRNRNRWVNGAPQWHGKGGFALFSKSSDGGRTWSRLEEMTLRNPDTSLEIVDLGGGKLIVFYNDSHDCPVGKRDRLSFALSSDGGHSWSDPYLLIENEGEFPSAKLMPDGKISLVYSNRAGQLHQMTMDPAEIVFDGRKWLSN